MNFEVDIERKVSWVRSCLPEDQQDEAELRVRRAHSDGVTHIGLWTGDEDPDITDLVGNCPRKRAECRVQGDKWSSGLIFLDKYASDA